MPPFQRYFRCPLFILVLIATLIHPQPCPASPTAPIDLEQLERPSILEKANHYLSETPRTVTADQSERSEGGLHDFYSEGDYWWPDPENPEGPYIRRDGETNPDNFIAHRTSMLRLAEITGTLASAYLLTGDERYAKPCVEHLEAWFVHPATRMNPHLLYGQAIKGRYSGRSIGIIDTLHLVEVALAAAHLRDSPSFPPESQQAVTGWFRDYLHWINSHPYGLEEKQHPNNHGVCWSLQAAAFARLVGDVQVLPWIRQQFKSVYLGEMMAPDGSFPRELARTKPYGYSLFVIDAMAGVAQLASDPEDSLWHHTLPDGRSMRKGLEFITPYIRDKSTWPYSIDVMYWEEWPVRHPSLLLAGKQFAAPELIELWQTLESDPEAYEVRRNLPLRHPVLWVNLPPPPSAP